MPPGATVKLAAIALFPDGTERACPESSPWSSARPEVARVSQAGLLVGVTEGSSVVEVTCYAARAAFTVQVGLGEASLNPLEIHYLNVGQGDAALIIAPNGESLMIDDGVSNCERIVDYLHGRGIAKLTYHLVSHYHADHIGCAVPVLTAMRPGVDVDRGDSYTSALFARYAATAGSARYAALPGDTVVLNADSDAPVTVQLIVVGEQFSNENDRSIVAIVRFAGFDASFGGDISERVEPLVAPLVGRLEAYKVHHHGSRTSSSLNWLAVTQPRIAVVSVGENNTYGHPTQECLDRLHDTGTKTYWTTLGAGATPEPSWDLITGTTIVEMVAGSSSFSVRWEGGAAIFALW